MPRIYTRAGQVFTLPQELLDRGSLVLPILGERRMVIHTYNPIEGWWEPEAEAPPDPHPYKDDLPSPEFPGWELVLTPNRAMKGDCYVCIDPRQTGDYATMNTPTVKLANGQGKVCPEYGDTAPGPGFRIYRRKRIAGPVRILPSTTFSQPLPLP